MFILGLRSSPLHTPFAKKKSHEFRAAASRGLHGLNIKKSGVETGAGAFMTPDLVPFYAKRKPVVKAKGSGPPGWIGSKDAGETKLRSAHDFVPFPLPQQVDEIRVGQNINAILGLAPVLFKAHREKMLDGRILLAVLSRSMRTASG
jgi:hypothetical protein